MTSMMCWMFCWAGFTEHRLTTWINTDRASHVSFHHVVSSSFPKSVKEPFWICLLAKLIDRVKCLLFGLSLAVRTCNMLSFLWSILGTDTVRVCHQYTETSSKKAPKQIPGKHGGYEYNKQVNYPVEINCSFL